MSSVNSNFIHICLQAKLPTAVFVLLSVCSTFPVQSVAQQGQNLPDTPAPKAGSDPPAQPHKTKSNSVDPLTFQERLRIYKHSFVHPEGILGPLMGAGVGQARNTPPEWGQGAEGFGRRLASGYGRSVISRTIALGVGTLDHEDYRYRPCHETGIWRRGWCATTQTFVSRTPDGGSMPAFSRFAGVYGAGFIANAWEPPSQKDAAHALERGSTALASSVGWHIFEEFWPDIRKKLLHRPY